MRKFLKIFLGVSLLSSALLADINSENIISFEKQRISKNPNVEVLNIEVNTKKKLPIENWYGYILDLKLNIVREDGFTTRNVKDILFTNGSYISLDLLDAKTGKSLKSTLHPDLTQKYYQKSHLIAGNHNAKDKIVLFSDPLCPFCMDYVPEVINYVNSHKSKVALYYYHFPLTRIHPAAAPLSKMIKLADKKYDIKNLKLKVYQTHWDEYFSSKSTDSKKILEVFNKVFNTDIKLSELKDVDISTDIRMGEDVMVQGTPTIFINGKKDNTRLKYQTLGK